MMPLLAVAVLLLAVVNPSTSLPGGAPVSVCSSMEPFHGGGIPAETSTSPFRVTPFATVIGQSQVLQLQIESNPPNIVFKGFMMQARNANPPYEVLGKFENTDEEIKLIDCFGGKENTVTHSNTNAKKNLKLEWISPPNFVGEIVFNSTIAQEYDKFWVGLESSRVKIVPAGQVPAGGAGISTTRQPATTSAPQYLPTTAAPVVSTDPIYNGCDNDKGCFGFPATCVQTKTCKALLTVVVRGEKYIFEMKSASGKPAYIAFGLSKDPKMADASVIECVPEQGDVNIYSSWTAGPPKGNYGVTREGVPQNFFRLLEKSYNDGVIYCKLERDSVVDVKDETFDLINNEYHVLLAMGSALKANSVGYHDIGREVSGEKRKLSDTSSFSGKSKLLLRLHGAFMLVAWIGTASLGILLARYFKQTWVGSQMCGKDQWFAWHRFFMILTWVLTMAGFIVIFVEIGGWSSIQNPHPILGTVTTVLCFIQPFMAYFRPHPGTKSRPVFNWMHWLVGNLAHIFAIVTIFFAVKLAKAELPEWLDFIIVAFVAFHVVMHFILSIAGCASDRRHGQRVNSFPMADMTPSRTSMSSSERKQDAPFSSFRKLLLFFYILILILFVIAMVVIAVLAPIEGAVESLKTKLMSDS